MAEEFEQLRKDLEAIGQGHLFEGLDAASDEDYDRFANQLLRLNTTTNGGLVDYCKRSKRLLKELIERTNGDEEKDYSPPRLGERLRPNTPLFEEYEEVGISQSPRTAFVLVAGGLGERLGYSGAKVALGTDTLSGKSFLELHCEWIAAYQARARIVANDPDLTVPFAIMTSEDTHTTIRDMLNDSNKCVQGEMLGGLTEVTLLKQEKVPCLSNPRGDIALNPEDEFEIVTKPHGHGDVHSLLHKSGLADRWAKRGIEWIVLFQDTNALAFRAVSAALGSATKNQMDMIMVAVQRKRGEAMGVICNVRNKDGTERTLNVEYNLVNEDKVVDASGGNNSIFPGNINLLVIRVGPYTQALSKSGGLVPEFVNPKFTDSTKTEFKAPTRLECMMQDLPLLLRPDARVGFLEMDRFMCYSPVKNNLKDALAKYQQTGYAESASSCESDIYSTNRKLLAMSGVQIRTSALPVRRFSLLPFEDGARIAIAPSFGTTVAEIRSRFPAPEKVIISDRSALVLDGDIIIHQLQLDGHLVLKAVPGSRLVISCLKVVNEGSELQPVEGEGADQFTPSERLRGYFLDAKEYLSIVAEQPGEEIVIDRPF